MLSVMIPAGEGDEEKLAHTLASLVPAAVEGILREVVVVTPPAARGVLTVAEHAGCRLAGSLSAAISDAKGEWLLFLEPGARLREGWSESVSMHASGKGGPARFKAEVSGWQTIIAWFRLRGQPLARGLLISRGEAAALVRSEGGRERITRGPGLRTLPARLVPAG